MTCIVGIVEKDRIVMGGDSLGSNGHSKTVRKDAKVFKSGDFLMGFSSSFRMGQLLRYSFSPPTPREGQDVFEFMVNDFIEGIRICLRDGGYARNNQGEESGGNFLVGYRGRLFEIERDYQVGESVDGIAVVGCGEDFAKGAIYATEGMDARQRVEIALRAAEKFSVGVAGPFTIMEIGI